MPIRFRLPGTTPLAAQGQAAEPVILKVPKAGRTIRDHLRLRAEASVMPFDLENPHIPTMWHVFRRVVTFALYRLPE